VICYKAAPEMKLQNSSGYPEIMTVPNFCLVVRTNGLRGINSTCEARLMNERCTDNNTKETPTGQNETTTCTDAPPLREVHSKWRQ
jgi:hypothetical protein